VADAFKKLYQGQPGTGASTLYTTPGSTTTIIRHVRCVNNDSVERTVTLYDGGSAAANVILPATTIPPGGFIELDVFIVLEAAGTLQGKASAASQVTVTAYGVEIT
jgi:hypothetical protein